MFLYNLLQSKLLKYNSNKKIINLKGYVNLPINTFIREFVNKEDEILKISKINSSFDKFSTKNIFIDKITLLFKGIDLLSEISRRAIFTENAGGKSEVSEAFSIYYLTECYRAKDILLEMEIEYWCEYKMVDYICSINGNRMGVSVTRAMGYPSPDEFTYKDALELIDKKLQGLIIARNGVIKRQRFYHSILHIWCQTFRIAVLVKRAFSTLTFNDFGLDIKTDIMVFLTVCNHKCIYTNRIDYEKI